MKEKFSLTFLNIILKYSNYYFVIISLIFISLLILPLLTSINLTNSSFIYNNKNEQNYFLIISYIGIAMSFPLVVDGLLDLSIKNLLKRWNHWGMLTSILLPNILILHSSLYDQKSLYICSTIIGLLLRYIVLVINTLTVEMNYMIKCILLSIAIIRVIFIYLWSITLYYYTNKSFGLTCQVFIIICDVLMIFVLIKLGRISKGTNPAQQCLRVYCFVLILMLSVNLIEYCWNGTGMLINLLQTTKNRAIVDTINYAIIVIATLLPNRIYRRTAEDLNRRSARKRDFVRYVSHEVRTPLNAVYVGLHVLFQDIKNITSNSEILGVIEDIKLSCNDAVNILDGLLHFNEIDEGNAKIKASIVKLKSFMHTLVHPFYSEAKRLNITLNYFDEIGDESSPTYLIIDKLKIAMVIRSILASSIHMTPEHGSVEMIISLVTANATPPVYDNIVCRDRRPFLRVPSMPSEEQQQQQEALSMVRIIIKDTGAGVPKDTLDNIFNDSAQFRPIDYQSGLGTALDLWIAKEYVYMHGGNIGVISEGKLGQGCIFYVDLKITNADEIPTVAGNLENDSVFSHQELPKFHSNDSITTPTEIKNSIELVRDTNPKVPYLKTIQSLSAIPSQPGFFSLSSPKSNNNNNGSNNNGSINNNNNTNGTNPPLLISQPNTPTSSQIHVLTKQNSVNKIAPGDSLIQGIKLSRALVVDDVASNRKMLGRVIQPYFHEIEYAANGKIAVDLVQESETNENETRFNVIFMDCNMPVMDGMEATRRIRALGYRGRIFGVTGNALGEDMNEFLASGLDKVLTKPLNMEKFFQAMKDSENKMSSLSIDSHIAY